MDKRKFDAIAKNLASGSSRRTVIGGLFGGALALTGLSRAAGKPVGKVDICHYDEETDSFHIISVSENALDAHTNHGDVPYQPSVILDTLELIAANPASVDTGVAIAEGDSVAVTVAGVAEYHPEFSFDGNGDGTCYGESRFPCGSVVGVIGGGDVITDDSAFFMIGTGTVVTGTGGNLFLQYVDGCFDCYHNNLGSLQVTIGTVATC